MKFRLNEKGLNPLPASQLKAGDMAHYFGEIVVRTGGVPILTSLTPPNNWWTIKDDTMVTPLSPGSTVTLEQE